MQTLIGCIDLRHLGLLRFHAKTAEVKRILLTEMTARCACLLLVMARVLTPLCSACKIDIKEQFRTLPRRNMSPDGYVTALTSYLNTIIGRRHQAAAFWHEVRYVSID